MTHPARERPAADGRPEAVRYWDANLDPQNLERSEGGAARLDLEDEIAMARTPDWIAARDWLTGGDAPPAFIVDLGAGLGANAIALAREGRRVVAVDASRDRLRRLRERAERAGCSDRIHCVVAMAEALPFADGALGAVMTKSVLIHANFERAAAEIGRTLRVGGRAASIEPQPGNPFAWIYRRTLAPRAWRSITKYFDAGRQRATIEAIGIGSVRPFYLFSFFAFYFQFGRPSLRWFRRALGVLHPIDRALFQLLPPLRRCAWMGAILAEKRSPRRADPRADPRAED
jgi:SAM-dependent methyltransferase